MSDHDLMLEAISSLVQTRELFKTLAARKTILGNDNHIGDIGEYWVYKHFQNQGKKVEWAPAKNSLYDLTVNDGEMKISVKTITDWSVHGIGTQVKPLKEVDNPWTHLCVVYLSKELHPEWISCISLENLLQKPEFLENKRKRDSGTKTYPRVKVWSWLRGYVVKGIIA